jgi:hypothetical protein
MGSRKKFFGVWWFFEAVVAFGVKGGTSVARYQQNVKKRLQVRRRADYGGLELPKCRAEGTLKREAVAFFTHGEHLVPCV